MLLDSDHCIWARKFWYPQRKNLKTHTEETLVGAVLLMQSKTNQSKSALSRRESGQTQRALHQTSQDLEILLKSETGIYVINTFPMLIRESSWSWMVRLGLLFF
jgi:hypothetical protein